MAKQMPYTLAGLILRHFLITFHLNISVIPVLYDHLTYFMKWMRSVTAMSMQMGSNLMQFNSNTMNIIIIFPASGVKLISNSLKVCKKVIT